MECFHLIMLPEPESLKQHKAKLQPSGGMLGELLVPLPLPWLQQEFLQREVVTRLPMHLSTADRSVSEVGVKSRKEAGESPEVSISTIVTSDDQGVQIY